jgi:hypothetical protein
MEPGQKPGRAAPVLSVAIVPPFAVEEWPHGDGPPIHAHNRRAGDGGAWGDRFRNAFCSCACDGVTPLDLVVRSPFRADSYNVIAEAERGRLLAPVEPLKWRRIVEDDRPMAANRRHDVRGRTVVEKGNYRRSPIA